VGFLGGVRDTQTRLRGGVDSAGAGAGNALKLGP